MLISAAAVLLGCSRGDLPAGESLVSVDGATITKAALPAAQAGLSEAQRKAQVETLIAEQLMANAAAAEHLDLEPATAAALATARRQVLARSYMAYLASKQPVATEMELRQFYEAHPELFAQRKLYRVQELAIELLPDKAETIRAALSPMKTLGERANWLKQQGVRHETRVVVKPAEDWPGDLLPRLFKMRDGTAFDLPSEQGFSTLQLTGTEEQPITFEQAKPRIAAFMNNQRLAQLLKDEQERLRKGAKIEYVEPKPAP